MTEREAASAFKALSKTLDERHKKAMLLMDEGKFSEAFDALPKAADIRELFNLALLAGGEELKN